MPGHGRGRIERQAFQGAAELAEDRVHERVEEQVRPGDAEVAQQVLHPVPDSPTNERWARASSDPPSWPTTSTFTRLSPSRPR